MKKKLLSICLVVILTLAVICLASCKDESAEKLREINAALRMDYSEINLNISTLSDNANLSANYIIAKNNGETEVSYEVDRLNEFNVDDDNVFSPVEFMTHLTGTAVVRNDTIVSIDGDVIDESMIVDVANVRMELRLSYFGKISVTDNGITTRVINPQGFLNNDDFSCDFMTLKVIMAGKALSHITITYESGDKLVTMNYSFTR